jgi:hypothetical protein
MTILDNTGGSDANIAAGVEMASSGLMNFSALSMDGSASVGQGMP